MSEIEGENSWTDSGSGPESPSGSASGPQLAPARRALALRQTPAQPNPTPIPRTPIGIGAVSLGSAVITGDPEMGAPASQLWVILGFFSICFAAQLAMLIERLSVFRVPLRMVPFGLSLLLVGFLPDHRKRGQRLHPSLPLAAVVLIILGFGLFNQLTDSTIAGIAQIGLTLAILSPLLWVGRLQIGPKGLATIILFLWSFNAISSGVGALQVRFPGRFQPAVSTVVQDLEDQGVGYQIELADGTQMERPYGLTDQPGGAATAGLSAFVLGLGLLVSSKNNLMRVLYLAGMGLGLFVIYLSQVRASIVMCGVAVITFVAIMSARGEFARLTGALVALTVVIALSTSAAFVIGGSETRDRMLTLVSDDAGTVYQNNRGAFLEYTFDYVLPAYPVGAGLGRYGMMSRYFNKTASSSSLWAEIQWTAWAFDGGWLMVVAYPAAILVAMWQALKIGLSRSYGSVGLWAAIMTSYNVPVLAITFSYAFFLSQSGLEFWVLNAALFSAAQVYLRAQDPEVPEGFEVIPAPWRPEEGVIASGGDANGAKPGAKRRPLGRRALPAVVPVFAPAESARGDA